MIKQSFVLRVLAGLFIFLALPLLIACFIMFQRDYEQAIRDSKRVLEAVAKVRMHSIYHIKPFSTSFVGEVIFYLDLKNKMPKEISPQMSEELKKIKAVGERAVHVYLLLL